EELRPTRNPKIRAAHRAGPEPQPVEPRLGRLELLARRADREAIRTELSALLPEARLLPATSTSAPAKVGREDP
ncbi:MAG TPA: hypothetical protein VFP10_04970, partial [Candidatus Eisenbacteria bacterium]|nr:hypothetical protein [Candidatus Eisenbacteria bacterium]